MQRTTSTHHSLVVYFARVRQLGGAARHPFDAVLERGGHKEARHAPHQLLELVLAGALRRVELRAQNQVVQHGRLRETEAVACLEEALFDVRPLLQVGQLRHRLRLVVARRRIVGLIEYVLAGALALADRRDGRIDDVATARAAWGVCKSGAIK